MLDANKNITAETLKNFLTVHVPSPGAVNGQETMVLGKFLRDVAKLNNDEHNFRIFGPDKTLSNLLGI